MLALYRSGRQAEALRAAQRVPAPLRDELGLEPSAALRGLETAILEERDELAWVAPADPAARPTVTPRSPAASRRTVPAETTALVGRERDLELAGRLLETGRILTLFGPGGVGKTRLAHRLAQHHRRRSSPTACAWSSWRRCATQAR